MDAAHFQRLLYTEEGATLDFKRDQYPFVKASEKEKSELLKDILGFVNCWRSMEAFILIGIEEVQGGKSIVHGVSEHLQDHSLQQFVNNQTNRPIQFGYSAFEFEGKQVGVIQIELQKRPVFLKRNYGKLEAGAVYVRRGSSTDPTKPADPDEIALMGGTDAGGVEDASLAVQFAEPEREQSLGQQIEWSAEYCHMPESSEIPNLNDGLASTSIQLPGGGTFEIPNFASYSIDDRPNRHFYRQLANFEFTRRLCKPIRLVVINTGSIPATEVRIEASVPPGSGFGVLDKSDIPAPPTVREGIFRAPKMKSLRIRPILRHPGYTDIETNNHHTKIEIDCENLQPGRKVWTDVFYIAIPQSGEIQFSGAIFAANLVEPQEFTLSINADVEQTSMTVDDLIALGDSIDDDE